LRFGIQQIWLSSLSKIFPDKMVIVSEMKRDFPKSARPGTLG
jgi:hypothetical protein